VREAPDLGAATRLVEAVLVPAVTATLERLYPDVALPGAPAQAAPATPTLAKDTADGPCTTGTGTAR